MYNAKIDYEENQKQQFTEDEKRQQRYAAVTLNRIALSWENSFNSLVAPAIVAIEMFPS